VLWQQSGAGRGVRLEVESHFPGGKLLFPSVGLPRGSPGRFLRTGKRHLPRIGVQELLGLTGETVEEA
jgi:hypothetical protein